MARGGMFFMDPAVQAIPEERSVGASLAVTIEWSEREAFLRVVACQDQQSSAGTATPSSLVFEVPD
eukprot:6863102-Heterocapsa_arctica.AAC.1